MNGVKFGETSARNGGGNPELSLGAPPAPIGWSIGLMEVDFSTVSVSWVTEESVET